MPKRVQIERDEDGVRAVLPADMIDRVGLGGRDELTAVETDHGILLTADDDLEETMELYQRVREKFSGAFRDLA